MQDTQYPTQPSQSDSETNNQNWTTAKFGTRVMARIIDWLIIYFIQFIILFAAGFNGEIGAYATALKITYGVSILYFVVFHSGASQATPGKRLQGIKVVNTKGTKISFSGAFIREIFCLIGQTLMFGILMGVGNKNHITLHDKISNTRVVQA